MDRLSELLGHDVQFSYTALDRIGLNGYIERLQRPENLVFFFHDVVGIKCIEPAVLASRTDRYRAWVRQYAADREIPVLQAPKGIRKEDLVLPYYERLAGSEGVACVLASMEPGRTFVSYTPRSPAGARSAAGALRLLDDMLGSELHRRRATRHRPGLPLQHRLNRVGHRCHLQRFRPAQAAVPSRGGYRAAAGRS